MEELSKTQNYDKRTRMELLVWEGDYGLKSIDSECLHVITYCILTRAPVTIKYGRNSMMYYKKYPFLFNGNLKLRSVQDIISYLRLHGYTLDYNISLKQCTDSYAFANIIGKRFKEVMYYVWWLDEVNYNELTYAWYSKAMPFPFNHFYPRYCKKMAKRIIDSSVSQDEDKEAAKNYIFNLAAETFSALATRLGDSTFFYGDKPCSLDALVYAYLAPLVYIPFPSDGIGHLLRKWPSLIRYVDRVHKTLFPDLQFSCKYVESAHNSKLMDDDMSHEGSVLLPLIFACLFLVGAAYSKGLLNIRSLNHN